MAISQFDHLTPLLRPWGLLADTVLRLVQIAPEDLPGRFLRLPVRGMHALAIALHAAAQEPLAGLADRVRSTHPRDLLRAALPDAVPTLYGALARASLPVWQMASYAQLDVVLRSPGATLLSMEGEITPACVRNIQEILAADPVLWRARSFARDRHTREHVLTVLGLLGHLGLLREVAALPDGAGRPALQRRLRADLMNARCPDDEFPTVQDWARISTVGDLWRVGLRLRVCIRPSTYDAGVHVMRLVKGTSVFLWNEELQALAEVRRQAAGGLWSLMQAVQTSNTLIGRPVRQALERDLERGGLTLVPTSCVEALNSLLRVDGHRGHDAFGELEDREFVLGANE